MTAHSGQGDEPREGVVLPSGGDRWPAGQDHRAADSAPPAGQPWGSPWGPDAPQAQAPDPGAPPPEVTPAPGAPSTPPAPQAHAAPPAPYAPYAGPLPPAGPPPQAPASGGPPIASPPIAGPLPPAGPPPTPPQPQPPAGPPTAGPPTAGALPPESGAHSMGSPPWPPAPPQQPPAPPAPPAYEPPSPYESPDAYASTGPHAQSGHYASPGPHAQSGHHALPSAYEPGNQLPAPPEPRGHADAGAYPYGGASAQPPGAFEDATQLLPPQPAPEEQSVGWTSPVEPTPAAPPAATGGFENDATQYIPPQGGVPQPAGDMDATQHLPAYVQDSHASHGGAAPAAAPSPGQSPSSGQAPPGASGDPRKPPAEFDNLFRPAADEPAQRMDSTQPLPLFEQASAAQSSGPRSRKRESTDTLGAPEPERRSRRAGSGTRGVPAAASARRKPVLLGAAGATVLVIAGLLGGAALGGGDDEKDDKGAPTEPAEESKAPEPTPEPSKEKDPVEAQAKELDKLLADSNNSRDAVIRSVENIKKCDALPKAAKDLKAAADQRNGLVTRLNEIAVDQLPEHAKLKQQLTKAWKASAAADNHYAAWAKQVEQPRNCKDGAARSTPQLARANRASGEATQAKQAAAKLWNPTAREYGLSERQPTQL